MSKKDRKAIAISILYILVPITLMLEGDGSAFILMAPLVIYWGYRFVKNDISFLKTKGED